LELDFSILFLEILWRCLVLLRCEILCWECVFNWTNILFVACCEGLPTRPCYYDIDINLETGKVEGLE
jgi:hypothetical protein